MSVTLNGTTGYLTLATPIATGGMPWWMCAWVVDSGSTGVAQCYASQSKLDSDRYSGIFRLDNSSPIVIHGWSSSSDSAVGAVPFDATPRVAIGSFGGTTAGQIKMWAGNTTEGVNGVSVTDQSSTHTGITIGALRINSGIFDFAKAQIAEVHFFTGTPTDTEYTSLAGGTLPETLSGWIDGFALQSATDLTSIGGTRTLTLVGGVTSTGSHPITRGPAAPTLTSPTGTQTGSSTASGTVSTDTGSGTLYYYASTNSTETVATIKASGSSQAVSATGSQAVSFTGLSASTTYYAHYVHNAAGGDSSASNSASFTTTAGGGSGRAGAGRSRFEFGRFTR